MTQPSAAVEPDAERDHEQLAQPEDAEREPEPHLGQLERTAERA